MKQNKFTAIFTSNLKNFFALKTVQCIMITIWIILLINTDAYLSIYIVCGICAAVSVILNDKYPNDERIYVHYTIYVFSALLSMFILLSNYNLFLPWKKNVSEIILLLAGGFIMTKNLLLFAYRRIPAIDTGTKRTFNIKSVVVFIISFLILSLIYLAYLFISSYPGNLTADSINQIGQTIYGVYSNHHPFWHTIIIKAILKVGMLAYGNINSAVALYSIVQIIFLAASVSFSLMTLYLAGIRKRHIVLCGLPFATMPYHIVYSSTMWKDIVFGAAALLFATFLFRILKKIGNKTVNIIFLFVSVVAFCIWRSNGWIVMFASLIFFFLFFRKKHLKTGIIIAVALLTAWILRSPVISGLGISQPDFVESLSIPVQQVAKVIADNGHITDTDYELLNKIMDVDEVGSLYLSHISDPIKNEIRSKNHNYLVQNKAEYLKLWIRIGISNPTCYVKAWVDQTKGYYNSGYPYWIIINDVGVNDFGIEKKVQNNPVNTFFDFWTNKMQSHILFEPFISIGFNVWILAALALIAFLKHREETVLYVPLLMVIATLLIATPVFSEFRYAYSVFTTLPFMSVIGIHNFDNNKGD